MRTYLVRTTSKHRSVRTRAQAVLATAATLMRETHAREIREDAERLRRKAATESSQPYWVY